MIVKHAEWHSIDEDTWRLTIFEQEYPSGERQITDIYESSDRNMLLRTMIKEIVPFADELKKIDFRWDKTTRAG